MGKTKKLVKQSAEDSLALVNVIVSAMEEKKAQEIVVLDLREITAAVTDFFVICHADSTTQVDAIGQEVEALVKKHLGEAAWHKEGYSNSEWVLIDYVNVVAHVFQTDIREFYGIENLWNDAKKVKI